MVVAQKSESELAFVFHVEQTWSLNGDRILLRGDAVDNYLQVAGAGFHVERNVKVRVGGPRVADGHRAVVVGAAIENVPGSFVGDSHDRIVAGALQVVAVTAGLRGSVKLNRTSDLPRARTACVSRADSASPG